MNPPLKHSKQREAIMDFLKHTKDHPTADTIYTSLRETFPNISLGTVYRNLALLVERGDILKLSCDGKSDRFDATLDPHYHVICTQCGEVIDLEMESIDHINVIASANFPGKITDHVTYFRGTCAHCLENAEKHVG